jgi:hypothetical protein
MLRDCVIVMGVMAAALAPIFGEETPATGWSDSAEFSYVATAGNSEASTLGFKNKLRRAWERSSFELNAGGIRVETTTVERFAVDVMGVPVLFEKTTEEITAENYYLNGRFNRKLTERFFWYAGAGWDRNEPSGIENRYSGVGGIGNVWVDREDVKFRTDYGVTYTKQEDVVENAEVDDAFMGLRVTSKYEHKFGETTTYWNETILDENLDETSDYRVNMINSVAVTMSDRLAFPERFC